MAFLARLGIMLALVAVGVGARRAALLDRRRTDLLTDAAFYVSLPALIFRSTYDRPFDDLVSVALVGGVVAVMLSTAALGWAVHRFTDARATRSVALVQSYHSNLGFFGFPVVATTLGGAAAGSAAVVLGAGALVQVPLTVLILIAVNEADASLARELRGLATNPVLLSLAVGLAAAAVGVSIPAAVDRGLWALSVPALPIALLGVGASLESVPVGEYVRPVGSVVALNVLWMPAAAWLAFSALGADPVARAAGVVMFGSPTAVSTYVYANELGGDARFASLSIFVTTLASLGTLFVLFRFVLGVG